VTAYRALTAKGALVDCQGDSAPDAMADAATRCASWDWPVTLYAADERGLFIVPAWGGKRGLAGKYPEGETPEDAERLFGGRS
jgi:hypothetical protein